MNWFTCYWFPLPCWKCVRIVFSLIWKKGRRIWYLYEKIQWWTFLSSLFFFLPIKLTYEWLCVWLRFLWKETFGKTFIINLNTNKQTKISLYLFFFFWIAKKEKVESKDIVFVWYSIVQIYWFYDLFLVSIIKM